MVNYVGLPLEIVRHCCVEPQIGNVDSALLRVRRSKWCAATSLMLYEVCPRLNDLPVKPINLPWQVFFGLNSGGYGLGYKFTFFVEQDLSPLRSSKNCFAHFVPFLARRTNYRSI